MGEQIYAANKFSLLTCLLCFLLKMGQYFFFLQKRLSIDRFQMKNKKWKLLSIGEGKDKMNAKTDKDPERGSHSCTCAKGKSSKKEKTREK